MIADAGRRLSICSRASGHSAPSTPLDNTPTNVRSRRDSPVSDASFPRPSLLDAMLTSSNLSRGSSLVAEASDHSQLSMPSEITPSSFFPRRSSTIPKEAPPGPSRLPPPLDNMLSKPDIDGSSSMLSLGSNSSGSPDSLDGTSSEDVQQRQAWRPIALKVDHEWRNWPEVKIKVSRIPFPRVTTWAIYTTFCIHGTISRIEVQRGGAIVIFR